MAGESSCSSEANCAVFPEEGHPPMTVERWREVLAVYRSYGVNCMRFHSHIPPEAAFAAADEMGMLMQPELSHWNPETAFESPESLAYYTGELRQALRFLANHPSFVMLTLGNELASGELGHRRMEDLLSMAHAMDATRVVRLRLQYALWLVWLSGRKRFLHLLPSAGTGSPRHL